MRREWKEEKEEEEEEKFQIKSGKQLGSFLLLILIVILLSLYTLNLGHCPKNVAGLP